MQYLNRLILFDFSNHF